jgi:ATP-dependent DNA ligase
MAKVSISGPFGASTAALEVVTGAEVAGSVIVVAVALSVVCWEQAARRRARAAAKLFIRAILYARYDSGVLPFQPPLAPMLSSSADALPDGDGWLFEPKWDGFRTIVFRDGDDITLQSRDEKPMNRYFPELIEPLAAALPERCVLDGEIVIAGPNGLDFEALLLRIHPAAKRVKLLASETPASFVAWDLLAIGDEDLREEPLATRRERLEEVLSRAAPPVHLSPATRDKSLAEDWFRRFEGAGLDGVMAKRLDAPYQPGERTMIKVKHTRTADCVVAGFRWHKNGPGTMIGSLLLGLYDDEGMLHHVGVTSAFTHATRRKLVEELAPLRVNALEDHPWRDWAEAQQQASEAGQRMPGASSRWNRGKDLSWEPLRPERVCEVAYDHMQGSRFRHGARFVRWRPDKPPEDCRYDQLEVTPAYELERVFQPRHGS